VFYSESQHDRRAGVPEYRLRQAKGCFAHGNLAISDNQFCRNTLTLPVNIKPRLGDNMLSRKKKIVLAVIGGLLLVIAVLVLSAGTLSEKWLKGRIKAYVRYHLDADIEIESIDLDVSEGLADVNGITFTRVRPDCHMNVTVPAARVKFDLPSLLARRLSFEQVLVHEPQIVFEQTRPQERPTLDTLTRLEFRILGDFVLAWVQLLIRILEAFVGGPADPITIGQLTVKDGTVLYSAARKGAEPFTAHLSNVCYSASDVIPTSARAIVRNADLSADVELGEAEASYVQHFSSEPRTVSVNNFNLGYADRYFRQKDALVVNGGVLNVSYLASAEVGKVEAHLTDLDLAVNPDAVHEDFVFVPVNKLIDRIEQAGGNMRLYFEVDRRRIAASEDLKFVVMEVWKGLCRQVIEKYGAEALRTIREEGTEFLRDLFSRSQAPPAPNQPGPNSPPP